MKDNHSIPIQYIKKIGPKRAEVFLSEGIHSSWDLINYFPRNYVDRSSSDSINAIIVEAMGEMNVNEDSFFDNYFKRNIFIVTGTITHKDLLQSGKRKKYLKLKIQDKFGANAEILFFNFAESYNKSYQIGDYVSVAGKAELSRGMRLSFTHPEVNVIEPYSQQNEENLIIPIYPSPESFKKAGIYNKLIIEIIEGIIDAETSKISETLPQYIIEKYKFPALKDVYNYLHRPNNHNEIDSAKRRMKFEEILYFELFLALKQSGLKQSEPGITIPQKSSLARKVFQSLKYNLTQDQIKVINEISRDMASGKPMNRLLQGDVGSGKTIVATLCMLPLIEAGYQVAIMAPTAILAEQHYNNIRELLDDFGIEITLLTGGAMSKKKKERINAINYGNSQIVVGTHSLFEDYITFNNLGLLVIDEQHRFGVEQKAKTINSAKQSNAQKLMPHVLVMSATPIPRTLALTVYGDLDVSMINEKPANRLPIKTKVLFESQLGEAYHFIREEVSEGSQAYIVFPLVEKSDKLAELKSAIEYYDLLKDSEFANIKCGLLHGQMNDKEKEMTMQDFKNKKFDILISTTVIEVGIDVPNATVMMIQDAQKFGLSQLHQLRGRVGRGDKQSFCILATKDNFQFEYRQNNKDDFEKKASILRLKTMERTCDGFEIAEVDLKLRGPGDMLGTKQSGLPEFKFLDLVKDSAVISTAKVEAFRIIAEDPTLSKAENALLRENIRKMFKESAKYFNIA